MDYAGMFGGGGNTSSGGAGAGGAFDYSQYVGEAGFDPSEPVAAAPLDLAFILPASTRAYRGLRVVTWGLLGIWGMLGNAVCAAVIIRSKLIKSWTYSMILNLCVSDFLFCVHAVVLRFPGVILESYPYGVAACRLGMALLFLPLNVTLFSFLMAAFHRYMSIVHSQVKVAMLDRKWQPLVIVCIWCAAFGMSFTYFYPGEAFVSYWPDQCVIFGTAGPAVTRALTTIAVFIPIVVVVFFYLHIYVVVKRAGRRVATQGERKNNNSRRMAIILFILYITFTAIYLPFIIFYNVIDLLSVTVQMYWFSIGCFGLMLISSCNPLLYAVLFKDIRAAYRSALFPCMQKKNALVMELTQSSK